MSEATTVAAESAAPNEVAPLTAENAGDRWREVAVVPDAEEAAATEAPAEPEASEEAGEDESGDSPATFDASEVRKLIKARKLDEAAKLLGVDVSDLGIDKREHQALRKARQRAEAEQAKVTALKGEVSAEKEKVKAASAHFGTIADKYRAGDYTGAIEALFGVDIQAVQKLVEEQHSDPTRREILRMRRELEERQKSDEEKRKSTEQQEMSASQERQMEAYLDDVAAKLPSVAAKYAPLAEDRRFLRAVFDRQAAHYQEEGTHLPLGKAIRETAEQIRQSLSHWRSLLTEDGSSPSGGSRQSPARSATPKATKSVASAQGGSGRPSPVTKETAMSEWERIKAEHSRTI